MAGVTSIAEFVQASKIDPADMYYGNCGGNESVLCLGKSVLEVVNV